MHIHTARERIMKSSGKEFLKFQVNETNFGRVFLVRNMYICIKFLMYEILLWKLKLVSPIFIFAIKIQFLKNYLEGLFLPKNILLSSRF